MALQLVGRAHLAGGVSNGTVSLTSLSGGIASQPAVGDIIIVGLAVSAITAARTFTIKDAGGTDYDLIAQLYADDTVDVSARFAWKVVSGTADTSLTTTRSASMNRDLIMIEVWRGFDPASPFDVAAVTGTGINAGRPDPQSITPVTSGAVGIFMGFGTGLQSANAVFTSSDLSDFLSTQQPGDASNYGLIGGAGSYPWTSGAINPATWGGGDNSATMSWVAASMVLRPNPSQSLTPSLLTNAQTFYGPTIAPGPVGLVPPALVNPQSFYTAVITSTALIAPPQLSNDQTFFAPTILQVGVLSPPLVENEQVFFPPTVAAGTVSIEPQLLTNGQAFFGLMITPGAVTLTPPLIENAQTFFALTLSIIVPAITPPERRLPLAPALLSSRRLNLTASRLAQRRLEL